MKKNYLLFLLFTLMCISNTIAQTTLTEWNFDGSSTTPSTGLGNLTLIGAVAAAGTPYPAGTPGLSYSITSFPAQNTAQGTAGYQFAVNTTGYSGITISFNVSGSNFSSKWQRYEYTTNGTNWIVLENNSGGLTTGFTSKSYSLPATCDNNPNLAFRIVSIFRQTQNDRYDSIQPGNNYSLTGTWQIDNMRFAYTTLKRNENNISNLKVYPNPATTVVNITSDSYASQTVELFNVLGKKVFTSKVNNNQINVSSLPKGIYMLKIAEEDKSTTRKLVIE